MPVGAGVYSRRVDGLEQSPLVQSNGVARTLDFLGVEIGKKRVPQVGSDEKKGVMTVNAAHIDRPRLFISDVFSSIGVDPVIDRVVMQAIGIVPESINHTSKTARQRTPRQVLLFMGPTVPAEVQDQAAEHNIFFIDTSRGQSEEERHRKIIGTFRKVMSAVRKYRLKHIGERKKLEDQGLSERAGGVKGTVSSISSEMGHVSDTAYEEYEGIKELLGGRRVG